MLIVTSHTNPNSINKSMNKKERDDGYSDCHN